MIDWLSFHLHLPHLPPLLIALQQAGAQTAAAAKEVAVSVTRPQEVGAQSMSAIWIFFLQRTVKKLTSYDRFVATFPGADKWAHLTFAAIASLFAVIGIHVTGQWSADDGGTYVVALPAAATVVHNCADWIRQFAMQQFAYLVARDRAESGTG